jgi:hypothetical protein
VSLCVFSCAASDILSKNNEDIRLIEVLGSVATSSSQSADILVSSWTKGLYLKSKDDNLKKALRNLKIIWMILKQQIIIQTTNTIRLAF